MNTAAGRLAEVRARMREIGVHAFVVPSRDPHNSEYPPAAWQRRAWLSGFAGSAGDVALTLDKAGLWTDSRYYLQAEEELAGSGIDLFKLGLPDVPTLQAWLFGSLEAGQTLALDASLVSERDVSSWTDGAAAKGADIRWLKGNLVDEVWNDRPTLSKDPLLIHPEEVAGESVPVKFNRVRELIAKYGADGLVVAAMDSIAWLFNIRGSDVLFNPVVVSFALITRDEAVLYVDPDKVQPAAGKHLSANVTLRPYRSFQEDLARRTRKMKQIWLDPSEGSHEIAMAIDPACRQLLRPGPLPLMKATKNRSEIQGFRTAHLRDGVAMVRFLHWLSVTVGREALSELSLVARLEELRAEAPEYRGPSFDTISGYGPHGAIVHYRVTSKTDAPVEPGGLYLVDSGGQYTDGTTDITRTVALGKPTEEQVSRFTSVLQGHIALITARFPQGTKGIQLDTLARQPLWDRGLDYGHGTGHGIGSFLSVHEGPQSISTRTGRDTALVPGMFLSVEPGYYKTGAYGIRTENLVVVVSDDGPDDEKPFYRFDNVTLCPIDRTLIAADELTPSERDFVDLYHTRVRETLWPHLPKSTAAWLADATGPL